MTMQAEMIEMSLIIYCYLCKDELRKPGALIFDPPDHSDDVHKEHVCENCWVYLLAWLEQQRNAF